MKQSGIFKHTGVILLFGIVIAAIVIAVFYWGDNTKDKPEQREAPTATPTVFIAGSPLAVSPISPVSPLSPVSPPLPATIAARPDPVEIEAMIQRGIARYESRDYQGAMEIFNDVLALDPNNFLAYNARGSVYTDLEDYEKALADYTKAIELGPSFPHAYYNRGRVYSLRQRYDEALSDLQKSIELAPNEFGYRANGNIGLIHHQMGEYDKALTAFETSISYNKDERADVFFLRGETYTAMENYEAAISDYQAAIERFSRYERAYQSLGYAYYKTDQLNLAQQNIVQALSISPDGAIAHFYLGLIYSANEQFDEAETEIKQAVNLLDTLAQEQRFPILERVLAELEILVQKSPDEIEPLIKLMPNP